MILDEEGKMILFAVKTKYSSLERHNIFQDSLEKRYVVCDSIDKVRGLWRTVYDYDPKEIIEISPYVIVQGREEK